MNEVRPPQPGIAPGIRPTTPTPTPTPAAGPTKITIPIQPAAKPHDPAADPISLVDDVKPGSSKIKSISGGGPHGTTHTYKRQPNVNGQGAVRVRSFHGRLSDEGLIFIDDKINEWLDNHPEIEIKFVTTTIGVFEGKIREPALVMNVWY